MADIVTNTLQIGSNNLILQDAGARQNIATNTQDISDLKDGLQTVQTEVAATLITDTASGAIASFPDGAAMPVESLTVDIEPVQDLHGQDAPYPAGGSKNKFNPAYFASRTSDYTVNDDGTITIKKSDGTAWSALNTYELSAGTYTFSRSNSSGICDIRLSTEDYGTSHLIAAGASSGTFTLPADGAIKIKLGYSASSYPITTTVQIETGSTASAYVPYSNICPISGHTSAVVTRAGINMFDGVIEEGTINSEGNNQDQANRYRSKNYISVKPSQRYVFSKNDSKLTVNWRLYDINKTFMSGINIGSNPFTVPDGCYYLRFFYDDVINVTSGLQLEHSETPTTYESPNIQTYTIDLDGTRYGGTLDATTGVLTVDRQIVDMGTLTWILNGGYFKSSSLDSIIKRPVSNTEVPQVICSIYYPVNWNTTADKSVSVLPTTGSAHNIFLWVKDSSYTDAESFTTAMNGVQLCYTLATPFTVQLTAEEVTTLLGQNNIWADTGDIEVEYRADTKLYINKVLNA